LIRHRIAVIGILAVAAFSIFDFLLAVPALSFPDIDRYDKHVAEIAITPELPPSGIVGYWSDIEGDPNPNLQQEALQEYYLIQYALVPRVVVKGIGQKFVIANTHNKESRLPGANLELVRDFGTGFKVLRNKVR
jgi:hypothetical protein